MTTGFVQLSAPALSTATIARIYERVAPRAGLAGAVRQAGGTLVRPRWYKVIPLFGEAATVISVGSAFISGFNEAEVDWDKLENGIYDASDMAVFRGAFTEAQTRFLTSDAGLEADRSGSKYILIALHVMPYIAAVDAEGIGVFGSVLEWDPPSRR